MTNDLTSVNALIGTRVIGGKRLPHKIGKIQDVAFHPSEKRVIGFILRRSDFLLMFKRKNKFVSINGYIILDGRIIIRPERNATGRAAFKALDLSPNDYEIWLGLPVISRDGQNYGVILDVTFSHLTGKLHTMNVGSSGFGSVLHSKRDIPANMIKRYLNNTEISPELKKNLNAKNEVKKDEYIYGAILVSDKTQNLPIEEGLAKKAGKGAAVVADKAKKAGTTMSINAKAAATVAGTIVTDGAIATGKQLKKTKGMFSAFKEEYRKARHN